VETPMLDGVVAYGLGGGRGEGGGGSPSGFLS
jgi:hypothetical protein